MPIIPLPIYNWTPTSSVQPFTYKDGMSYLQILERLRGYIAKTLVPWLENEINNFEDSVEDNVTLITNYVNESVNKIINNSVELQDAVAASLITSESLTKDALDARYASVGRVSDIETGVEALEQLTSIGRLSDTELTAKIVGEAYSKADSDNRYPSKDSVFTKTDSDNRYPLKSDVYTKTAADAALDLKADKSSIIELVAPIIATHFLTENEAVYVSTSMDGVNFHPSNVRWKPADNAELGEAWARDPSIILFGGYYYIAYTRVGSKLGGAFGTTNSIGLVRVSTDFQTWEPMEPIRISGTVAHTWAPEWFLDSDNLPRIIYAMRTTVSGTFKQYVVSPLTPALSAWGGPVEMSGLDANIDAKVLKIGSKYHAFTSSQSESRLKHYSATALTGPYALVSGSQINTGPFSGYEGPAIAALKNGGYRMYIDAYNRIDAVHYTDSFDLLNWTNPTPVSHPMRHIGLVQTRDLGNLRDYPQLKENVGAMQGDAAPYWGAKRKPGDINREWIQSVVINTGGGGWAEFATPDVLGFSGVDVITATLLGDDSLPVCAVKVQINSGGKIAASLWSYTGSAMLNTSARIAVRVVGWGPIGKR